MTNHIENSPKINLEATIFNGVENIETFGTDLEEQKPFFQENRIFAQKNRDIMDIRPKFFKKGEKVKLTALAAPILSIATFLYMAFWVSQPVLGSVLSLLVLVGVPLVAYTVNNLAKLYKWIRSFS